MGDFEGRILIASKRDIYALIAVPLEKQVYNELIFSPLLKLNVIYNTCVLVKYYIILNVK